MKVLNVHSIEEANALFFAFDTHYDISRDEVSEASTYQERNIAIDKVAAISIARHYVTPGRFHSNSFPIRILLENKEFDAVRDAIESQLEIAQEMAKDDPGFLNSKFEIIVELVRISTRFETIVG